MMGYAVCFLSLFAVLSIIAVTGAGIRLVRLYDENKRQKKLINDLQYKVQTLYDAEQIRNENRKEAQQKMDGIDYGDVSTALDVLRDGKGG